MSIITKKRNRYYGKGKNKAKGSNIQTGRDYTKSNAYNATPEQIANRVKWNRIRREMIKKGRVKRGDNKDIDHIKPMSKGGSGKLSNLRVISRSANRSKKAKYKGK